MLEYLRTSLECKIRRSGFFSISLYLSSQGAWLYYTPPHTTVKTTPCSRRPVIVFHSTKSETLFNYASAWRGLNFRPCILSGSAIFEPSDESCTAWCNQRARLLSEVVQTRGGNPSRSVGWSGPNTENYSQHSDDRRRYPCAEHTVISATHPSQIIFSVNEGKGMDLAISDINRA